MSSALITPAEVFGELAPAIDQLQWSQLTQNTFGDDSWSFGVTSLRVGECSARLQSSGEIACKVVEIDEANSPDYAARLVVGAGPRRGAGSGQWQILGSNCGNVETALAESIQERGSVDMLVTHIQTVLSHHNAIKVALQSIDLAASLKMRERTIQRTLSPDMIELSGLAEGLALDSTNEVIGDLDNTENMIGFIIDITGMERAETVTRASKEYDSIDFGSYSNQMHRLLQAAKLKLRG